MGFWVRCRISPFDLKGIDWLDRLAAEQIKQCKEIDAQLVKLNREYKILKARAETFQSTADIIRRHLLV